MTDTDSQTGSTKTHYEHYSGGSRPSIELPEIDAKDGDLAGISDAAWAALQSSNDPPWLFRHAGLPSRIEADENGGQKIVPLTQDSMRGHLARRIHFFRTTKQGNRSRAYPPLAVAKDMLAMPAPDLPVLERIVRSPVFACDGSLQIAPGYNRGTRLFYSPAQGLEIPEIRERPTDADLARAKVFLLYELLGDFPFVGKAERAHTLAMLIQNFVRPLIDGPTPLYLIEKPSPGTGGGLLIQAISVVVTGTEAKIMTEGRNEEEQRKRITAVLRNNPEIVIIDNLSRPLDSAALSAAITAPIWSDRLLSSSTTVELPVSCIWVATGNNPRLSNEMARRTVRIRLDAKRDKPWTRTEFKHKNLIKFARECRGDLIWSVLTLVQSWLAAGRPQAENLPALGMFDEWADVIGSILGHVGCDGFLGNLQEFYETSDAEGEIWRAFISDWWRRFAGRAIGVADLFTIADEIDPPLPLGDGSERSQKTRLGKLLSSMRDRQFIVHSEDQEQELRICPAGIGTGAQSRARLWKLELVIS